MIYEREYGVAATISFPIIAFSLTSYHSSLTSTIFAAGDVLISKDYAAGSATATLPSGVMSNGSAFLSMTAAELQGAHVTISIIDQTATKVFEDQTVIIETYGATTAAQHQFNRNVQWPSVNVASVSDDTAAADNLELITEQTRLVQASLTTGNVTQTAQAVWNQTMSALVAAGTFGGGINNRTTSSFVAGNTAVTTTIIIPTAANVNTEVDTALVDIGLDHLISAAVAGADVTDNSIFAKLVSATTTADWDDFVPGSHSLQALRERGDAAWITGGGATTTAQLVWNQTMSAVAVAGTFGGSFNNRTVSSFVPTASGVTLTAANVAASLTASQSGVTISNVTTVATVNNLGASATAQVNTQMADVLKVDTITEQSAGVPPAAPTFEQAIDYIYMAWRNKVLTTASVTSISNDAGTTIASAVISDDGTTFTKNEFS